MSVIFADVQQFLPMIDTPPAEKPLGGVASDLLILADSARPNLYPQALAQLLTLRQYALLDFARYHQAVSDQLFFQSGVVKGPSEVVSQLLGLGDTAWHGDWELPAQSLSLTQTLLGTNAKAATNDLSVILTQTVTTTTRRNLTVTQTLILNSGSGGYNAQERCFSGYRVLSGPNSGGGA